jgi:hypothetical protein
MKVLLYRTVPALTPIPMEDHEAMLSAEGAATKGKLKQRITINECDMESEVMDEVVAKAKRLLEHFNEDPDVDSKVALALKVRLLLRCCVRFAFDVRALMLTCLAAFCFAFVD